MKPSSLIVPIVASLAMLAAACGGSDSDAKSTSTTASESSETTTDGGAATTVTTGDAGDDGSTTSGDAGDDGSTTTQDEGATTDDTASSSDLTLSDEFCEALKKDSPTAGLVDSAPEGTTRAIEALVNFVDVMNASDTSAPDAASLSELVAALGEPGVGDQLADLGVAADEQCGASDAATGLAQFSVTADVVAVPKDQPFCDALKQGISAGSDATDFDAVIAAAPDQIAEEVESLKNFAEDARSEEGATTMSGTLLGLGLYAEVQCEIPNGFVSLASAAVLASPDN